MKNFLALSIVTFLGFGGCHHTITLEPPVKSSTYRTDEVTHYYVPLLGDNPPRKSPCHTIEGVCKFNFEGIERIYYFTGRAAPAGEAFAAYAIKNSEIVEGSACEYGIAKYRGNCTHPCRSLAASLRHHERGQLLFFPALVGKSCGVGESTITHDGYMFVNDTGAPSKFNKFGRFDFFWGDCTNFSNGVCRNGNATFFDRTLDGAEFTIVWTPSQPETNRGAMERFSSQLRLEAKARNDGYEAVRANLSDFIPGGRHTR